MDQLAEQVVDAINDDLRSSTTATGRLMRRGRCFAARSRAPVPGSQLRHTWVTGAVPVTARFSNGGGDPGIPDYAKEGRGLAVKFYLPDGSKTDIVALSLPCFFVRTPEDFLEFTRLRKPDPGDRPARLREARRVDGPAPGGGARDPGRADRRPAGELRDAWPTTRSTRSGGPRRTAPSAGCATASSRRRASGRCRRRRPARAGATTCRRRSSRGRRPRSGWW